MQSLRSYGVVPTLPSPYIEFANSLKIEMRGVNANYEAFYGSALQDKDSVIALHQTLANSRSTTHYQLSELLKKEYSDIDTVNNFEEMDTLIGRGDVHIVARYCLAQARGFDALGDYPAATDWSLLAFSYSDQVSHNTTLERSLCGIKSQYIARQALWQIMPYLDNAETMKVKNNICTIISERPGYIDVFMEERRARQRSLISVFKKPGWRKEWSKVKGIGWRIYTIHKGNAIKQIDNILVEAIAAPSRDYRSRVILADSHVPPGWFYAYNWPPVSPFYNNSAKCDAANSLLLTAYSLRMYYQSEGKYPSSLNSLCPEILDKLPVDPYGSGSTLGYSSLDSEHFKLWSVGKNGVVDTATSSNANITSDDIIITESTTAGP